MSRFPAAVSLFLAGAVARAAEVASPAPALSGPVAFVIIVLLFVVVLGDIALFVR